MVAPIKQIIQSYKPYPFMQINLKTERITDNPLKSTETTTLLE